MLISPRTIQGCLRDRGKSIIYLSSLGSNDVKFIQRFCGPVRLLLPLLAVFWRLWHLGLRPLLHYMIHQPIILGLVRGHVIVPLQILVEPIFCRLSLFVLPLTMAHVDISQGFSYPEDLLGVDGDIRRWTGGSSSWFCVRSARCPNPRGMGGRDEEEGRGSGEGKKRKEGVRDARCIMTDVCFRANR